MITDVLAWIWCILKSFFYWVIENIFAIIDIIGQFALFLLPNSPFQFEQVQWGMFGDVLGFFLPVATIIQHMLGILTAISIYYAVRHLLRLIKQVR